MKSRKTKASLHLEITIRNTAGNAHILHDGGTYHTSTDDVNCNVKF